MAFRSFASSVLSSQSRPAQPQPVFYSTRDSFVPFDAEDDILGASLETAPDDPAAARRLMDASVEDRDADDTDDSVGDSRNSTENGLFRAAGASVSRSTTARPKGWRAFETALLDDVDSESPALEFLSPRRPPDHDEMVRPLLHASDPVNRAGLQRPRDKAFAALYMILVVYVLARALWRSQTSQYDNPGGDLAALLIPTSLIALLVSIAIGIVSTAYLAFTRHVMRFLVPIMLFAVPAIFVSTGVVTFIASFNNGQKTSGTSSLQLSLRIYSVAVWVLVIVLMRSVAKREARIRKIVSVFQTAAELIRQNPSLIVCAGALSSMALILCPIFVFTIATTLPFGRAQQQHSAPLDTVLSILAFAWTISVLRGVQQCITASLVARLYFGVETNDHAKVWANSLSLAHRTVREHFGTIVLASATSSVLSAASAVLASLRWLNKQFYMAGGTLYLSPAHSVLRFLSHVVSTFNTYVLVHAAITKESYSQSAREVYKLLSSDATEVMQMSALIHLVYGCVSAAVGLAVGALLLVSTRRDEGGAAEVAVLTSLCLTLPTWALRCTHSLFTDTVDALLICTRLNKMRELPIDAKFTREVEAAAQIVFLISTLSDDNFAKNRDEIRALVDTHGPAAQQLLVRRLISTAAPALSTPKDKLNEQTPPMHLVLRLLATELHRLARDPGVAERLRDAVTDPGSDSTESIPRDFSLSALISNSAFADVSALEQLVLAAPFAALLSTPHGSQADAELKRAIAADAMRVLRRNLPAALDQLGKPPSSSSDVPELSPLSISRLFVLLLSNRTPSGDSQADAESSLSASERRELVLAAVRGRLGFDVGSQTLAHAAADPALLLPSTATPVSALLYLAPTSDLCSPDLVRAVIDRFGGLHSTEHGGRPEAQVASMLSELIEYADKNPDLDTPLNARSWVQAIHAIQPALRLSDVIRIFDRPSAILPGVAGIRLLARLISTPLETPTSESISLASGLWAAWTHRLHQVALLDRLLYLTPDVFSFAEVPSIRRAVAPEHVTAASSAVKASASSVWNSSWNCVELVHTLVKIGDGQAGDEASTRAHELIERGCKTNPELVFAALVQTEKPWSALTADLVSRLSAVFLGGHPSAQLALLRLWQTDSSLLGDALRDLYAESELNVSRIVDIASELKILDFVLDLPPTFLALDVAALASRREFLNLDKWLSSALASRGEPFVQSTLEYLGHKARHDLQRQELESESQPTTLSLSAQTVATFIRALRLQHELFSVRDVELFKEIRTLCLQLYPRLMNFSPGNADSEPGMAVVSFSSEIESECDALYRRMYDQEVSIEEVVNALKRAQESDNAHDHEFFACFLHGLFDEHRFFNTYPANELALTAALFGDLIQYQLIDFVPLGIAVRYVLDALRHPPQSNWFRFGIQALQRFRPRLAEWPQLAQSILAIPHVQDLHSDLADAARQALQQGDTDLEATPDVLDLAPTVDFLNHLGATAPPDRPVFTAIAVNRDAADEPEPPDEETSDKILFIVNNLAPSNFDSKVAEMSKRIDAVHFSWFAHYLVARRVSIEPNNHALYQRFLDALDLPPLINRVLHETYVKLATLLNSEKTVQSSTERTLLKNLGSWLGGLTLARDRPIKQQNISFKELLIQGYDSNRLIVAIPFVCKVLEQSAKSRVFKPPNPWLMGILRLLVELYHFAELKLNLKFEIEVLCKSLNLDLKEVEPTDSLRSRPKDAPQSASQTVSLMPREMDEQAFARSFAAQPAPGAQAPPAMGEPARGPAPALMLGSNQAGYSLSLQDSIAAALQPLPTQLVFGSQAPMFSSNAALQRLVFVAFDRAIREIIAPVVERSVTIAGISTRELTMKDFAMEGDEARMAQAAHLMVQNLAGSLALVTCKEPLRVSIVTHVRQLLLQNGYTEQSMPEQAVLAVAADNLDFACAVVEKVAMEKAMLEVDDGLAPAYLARRTHRERSREAFWDTAAMAASHYSGMLPDPLRLKLGGLQPQQLQVYEDFARVRSLQVSLDGKNGLIDDASLLTSEGAEDAIADGAALSGSQAMDKFAALINELEVLLAQDPNQALARVPAQAEIRQVMNQVLEVASKSSARDETALACSQKVVQLLYRSTSSLAREVFTALLEQLCTLSVKVAREVMAWLVYAEDERKFNVPVTIALVQAQLINLAELDTQLAKFVVRDYKPSVIDFVSMLAVECLAASPQIATAEQLSHCFDALAQANRSGKGTDLSKNTLTKIRGSSSRPSSPERQDDSDVRQQLVFSFAEWVRMYQQSASVEKSFVEFVVSLQNQGVLKGEEISSLFFRVCTEVSVDSYIKHKAAGGSPATGIFQPVDAFAKLIVFMIKYHADPTGANNDKAKVHYMTKVLSIVVLVLANSHEELGPHFQQKPFYRFFSSLLSNLHAIEGHLGSAYYQILVALSHSLNTLQPTFFPGFTFSWVSLVSHRLFMPKLLATKDKEGWLAFQRQLVSFLRFLGPFMRRGELGSTTRALYLGIERIFLVLLHDFPDFLAQAAFALCDVVPARCVQLHNLILSAFPVSSAMRLPDPLQNGLQLEPLAESHKSPQILSDFTASLSGANLRAPVDKYLQTRSSLHQVVELVKQQLVVPNKDDIGAGDESTNIALANSFVLYLGAAAINQTKASSGSVRFDSQSASVALLQALMSEVEPEQRYYLVCATANQLRYPNAHTWWFSEFLLNIFSEAGQDGLRESIVRVLLERVVAHRPHVWGVLFTFNQLLDDRFGLLKHKFVQAAPEVAHLLSQVSTRARALSNPAVAAAA
ncbi:CCR4-NOT core subunit cdc39 [Microbotryomycetes sp. JL201]|nr:CCR4-NOT core subunit cdc39 [Microbotryomycetes sp. JL201]